MSTTDSKIICHDWKIINVAKRSASVLISLAKSLSSLPWRYKKRMI